MRFFVHRLNPYPGIFLFSRWSEPRVPLNVKSLHWGIHILKNVETTSVIEPPPPPPRLGDSLHRREPMKRQVRWIVNNVEKGVIRFLVEGGLFYIRVTSFS